MIPAKQCIQYASGNSCFFGVPTMEWGLLLIAVLLFASVLFCYYKTVGSKNTEPALIQPKLLGFMIFGMWIAGTTFAALFTYKAGKAELYMLPIPMICGVAGFHASLALADTAVKVHHRVAKALNRNRTP